MATEWKTRGAAELLAELTGATSSSSSASSLDVSTAAALANTGGSSVLSSSSEPPSSSSTSDHFDDIALLPQAVRVAILARLAAVEAQAIQGDAADDARLELFRRARLERASQREGSVTSTSLPSRNGSFFSTGSEPGHDARRADGDGDGADGGDSDNASGGEAVTDGIDRKAAFKAQATRRGAASTGNLKVPRSIREKKRRSKSPTREGTRSLDLSGGGRRESVESVDAALEGARGKKKRKSPKKGKRERSPGSDVAHPEDDSMSQSSSSTITVSPYAKPEGASLQERLDELLAHAVLSVPRELLLSIRAECLEQQARSDTPAGAPARSGSWRSSGPSDGAQHQRMLRKAQSANLKLQDAYDAFWNIPPDFVRPRIEGGGDNSPLTRVEAMTPYVPSLVMRKMIGRLAAGEQQMPAAPVVEKFLACVMFADISGFTPLTEKLAKLGKEGVEKLTAAINDYFSSMIDLIASHGGDILKFAGDAVLVVWPTNQPEMLPSVVVLACQCALDLMKKLSSYTVDVGKSERQELLLHIGIGAGPAHGVQVGGTNDRFEYFLAGDVLDQVSACEKEAGAGETFVSSVAWLAVEVGRLVGKQVNQTDPFANYRLSKVGVPAPLPRPISPALAKLLPPEVEDELEHFCQPAAVRHLESGSKRWLAELRLISVVFVNLARPFSPHEMHDLQLVITALQKIVFKHEGIVRQFMIDDKGSVFIAGFGCPPLFHPDDPRRAVSAALEILGTLESHKMPGSVGVTTGEAYVGDVGSSSRREYAMVGDVVNLAARLMMAAKSGILVDRATHDAVADLPLFAFDWLAPIEVKGKSAPIPVFVPRFATHAERHDHGHHQHGDIHNQNGNAMGTIGRSDELNVLEDLVETISHLPKGTHSCLLPVADRGVSPTTSKKPVSTSASSAAGDDEDGSDSEEQENERMALVRMRGNSLQLQVKQRQAYRPAIVVVLEGAQGLGKSRLMMEVQTLLEGHGANVIRGVGSQLASSTPYGTWFDILKQVCLKPADGGSELKEGIVAAVGEEEISLLNGLLPSLNAPESELTANMSSKQRADRLLTAAVRALGAGITPGSTLIIDDAHHMDSSSWALLEKASSQLSNIMIIVGLCPLKEEILEHIRICRSEDTTCLVLSPLSAKSTSSLVASILKVKRMPDEVAEAIHEKAQGNPFYIEQICEMIRESGSLQVQDGLVVHSNGLLDVLQEVPSSVTGLITTKFDRLDPAQQVVLRLAAVMGRSFSVSMLERLLPLETDISMDRGRLLRQLATLENMDMIKLSAPDPDRAYAFASTLVMEVIYNAMLFSHRRDVHLKLAELYEEAFTGQSQYDSVLAFHKERGEQLKEAQRLYVKAGSNHLARYAIPEAVELLQNAVHLISKRGKEGSLTHITVERKLGQAFLHRGVVERARVHFEEALRLMGIEQFSTDPKSSKGVGVLKKITSSSKLERKGAGLTKKWNFTQDSSLSKPGQLAHRKREAAISLLGLAAVNYRSGKRAQMLFTASTSLELARDQGTSEQCEALCAMLLTCADDDVAASWITDARSLAQQRTELMKVVCRDSGILFAGRRYWARADKALREATGFADDVGDSQTVELCLVLRSTALAIQGIFGDAVELLTEALSSAQLRSDDQTKVLAMNVEAWIRLMKGQFRLCARILEQVKVHMESETTDSIAEINYFGLAAAVSGNAGKVEDAWSLVGHLEELLQKTEPTSFLAFPGYACFPEVFYSMLNDEKLLKRSAALGHTRLSIIAKLRDSALYVTRFADQFPFAQPRAALWRAVVSCLDTKKKMEHAEREFAIAQEEAVASRLQYDQALILFEKGQQLSSAEFIEEGLRMVPRLKYRRPGDMKKPSRKKRITTELSLRKRASKRQPTLRKVSSASFFGQVP